MPNGTEILNAITAYMIKWLYESDFQTRESLHLIAEYWKSCGYRVFVAGYSSINPYEV